MRGPVLLRLAVTPQGSLGSQPPCLLLPLPLLLPGLRKLTGQRVARQGDLAPRHQVPLPVPATSSHRKALPRPDPRPSAPEASDTGPEAAGCLSPGGAHQENSLEQTFASCSGLGFSSGDRGCILPACGMGAAGSHTQV